MYKDWHVNPIPASAKEWAGSEVSHVGAASLTELVDIILGAVQYFKGDGTHFYVVPSYFSLP